MVVDDDDGICSSLGELLEAEGYTPVITHDGQQALEQIFKLKRPALIFLDLRMPIMSGEQFLEKLRSNTTAAHDTELDYVVVMTAARITGVIPGANDVLSKPFEVDSVINIVEHQMAPYVVAAAKAKSILGSRHHPESMSM
jgi:two-component system response regulator RegX3